MLIPQAMDSVQLRKAIFGCAQRSDSLERALLDIHIVRQDDGRIKARAEADAGDHYVAATAHALAHRLEMGRDLADYAKMPWNDATAWSKVGTTLYFENIESSETANTLDRDDVERGARTLIEEAFADRFISEHKESK